jgi:hypothetical protein
MFLDIHLTDHVCKVLQMCTSEERIQDYKNKLRIIYKMVENTSFWQNRLIKVYLEVHDDSDTFLFLIAYCNVSVQIIKYLYIYNYVILCYCFFMKQIVTHFVITWIFSAQFRSSQFTSPRHILVFRIWRPQNSDYEEFCFLGYIES